MLSKPNILVLAALCMALLSISGARAGSATQAEARCEMEAADRSWLGAALAKWIVAEQKDLGLTHTPLPTIHAYGAQCSFVLANGSLEQVRSTRHDGDQVPINGRSLPLGPMSFADGSGTFVMSLPSLWRLKGVNGTFGVERLMDAVLLHEIMHTRQAQLASEALAAVEAIKPKDVELSDDLIQERFGTNAAYKALYERERDLLYQAHAASSDKEARRLGAQALRLMEERRRRFFVGQDAFLAPTEDVFLTMEGMGQWLGYRMYRDLGVREDFALREVRRGNKFWSQDEGLGIVLLADRLLPDWKQRAFRASDWRASSLLRASVQALRKAGSDGSSRLQPAPSLTCS